MHTERKFSPLAGLHVLELGTGVAAPYAGALLAKLGAQVVKLETPQGDPSRHYPLDDRPLAGLSPLYRYLNAGKANATWTAPRLAAATEHWAEVVIDSRVRREVEPSILDGASSGKFKYASVTAWGFEHEDAGSIDDELIVQAQSGVMTLTGDLAGPPMRLPGFQSQYLAGAYTAASVLASLADRGPQMIEVAWLSAIATGAEGSFQRYLYTEVVPLPAGAHPPASFPSGAFRCADGFVVPGTVRYHDWQMQCILYGKPDLVEDPRFATPAERTKNLHELWSKIQPWYDGHTRMEIFQCALDVGWACGMVLGAGDALSDPHLRERGFLGSASGSDGEWTAPARLARGYENPGPQRLHDLGSDDAWFDSLLRSPQ